MYFQSLRAFWYRCFVRGSIRIGLSRPLTSSITVISIRSEVLSLRMRASLWATRLLVRWLRLVKVSSPSRRETWLSAPLRHPGRYMLFPSWEWGVLLFLYSPRLPDDDSYTPYSGQCFYCKQGFSSRCDKNTLLGCDHLDGAQAQYVSHPDLSKFCC